MVFAEEGRAERRERVLEGRQKLGNPKGVKAS